VVQSLADVSAQTAVVRISGFVGRPDQARKAVGNQFFFLNGRYFRSSYFHRAVMKAYEQLIPEGVTPAYCLYLEVDPHSVDVNIHPSKAEIKFEDDSIIFQTLYACVREVIGRNSFAGSIDFESEGVSNLPVFGSRFGEIRPDPHAPQVQVDGSYDPFSAVNPAFGTPQERSGGSAPAYRPGPEKREDYGKLFEEKTLPSTQLIIVQGKVIVTPAKSGLMAVHVKRARERILYERFLDVLSKDGHASQVALFPVQVQVGAPGRMLFEEHAPMLSRLGFDIASFGQDTVVVNAVPEGYNASPGAVETLVGDLLLILSEDHTSVPGQMTSALAERFALLGATGGEAPHSPYEAQQLIDSLFACENAEFTPSGHSIVALITLDDLLKKM
jgi:DNA mismatch repair protein MutL